MATDMFSNKIMDKYIEVQTLKSTWYSALVIVISLAVLSFMLYAIYQQIILGKPFGDNPSSDLGLIASAVFVSVICGSIAWLMWAGKLHTQINKEDIRVRFFPFHGKQVITKWSEVKQAELKKYRPMIDFGGYGIRWIYKGKAYNVKGKFGLELQLHSGKKLIIGTQNPEKLEAFLETL